MEGCTAAILPAHRPGVRVYVLHPTVPLDINTPTSRQSAVDQCSMQGAAFDAVNGCAIAGVVAELHSTVVTVELAADQRQTQRRTSSGCKLVQAARRLSGQMH